jgi:hypothetical protein
MRQCSSSDKSRNDSQGIDYSSTINFLRQVAEAPHRPAVHPPRDVLLESRGRVRGRSRRDQTRIDPASFDECPGVFQAFPRLAGEKFQPVISLFRDGHSICRNGPLPHSRGILEFEQGGGDGVVVIRLRTGQRIGWLPISIVALHSPLSFITL